jgi:hypothetical protein
MAQVSFVPNDRLSIGLTGVHAFRKGAIFDFGGGKDSAAFVGNALSNPLAALKGAGLVGGPEGVVVNGGGISAAFKLSDKIVINGFASFFVADVLRDRLGNGDIFTAGLGVSFPDFGKAGNLLGLFAGLPPYLRQDGEGIFDAVGRKPLHVEGFYRIRLNDNISITPGVIWVINPNQIDGTDTLIGTVRTTFTF